MRALKWLGIELVEVSLAEKCVAAFGSAAAIAAVFVLSRSVLPLEQSACVIASMGASAVLLFAVPHGPLSQPWPLIGGHFFSAVIGVFCAKWISEPSMAAAVAVGAAIAAMHQLKCIHPPGGATAFTAVMGGDAVRSLGFNYILHPVMLNAIAMLALAVVINYAFPWRRYPASLIQRMKTNSQSHVAEAAEPISEELHHQVIEALRSIDSFVDVSEEDLLYLTRTLVLRISDDKLPKG